MCTSHGEKKKKKNTIIIIIERKDNAFNSRRAKG